MPRRSDARSFGPEALSELKEAFWIDFSALVNDTLDKVPPSHRPLLATMLQEASSVYGRAPVTAKLS